MGEGRTHPSLLFRLFEAKTMNLIYSIPTNFVNLIRSITTAYNLDFDRDYLSLRLDLDHSDEILLIEKLDEHRGVVSTFKTEQGLETPLISLEFLIEFYDLMEDDDEVKQEAWYPLSLTRDGEEPRLIASADSLGKLMAYDEQAMKEAAALCLTWWRELEKQGWHNFGHPAPDVTATVRYAQYQTVSEKLSDAPVIEFEGDYRIKANRLGLYALVGSITGALAEVSGNGNGHGSGTTVFDLHAGAHKLQVELVNGVVR
jgi:hypothetical protein